MLWKFELSKDKFYDVATYSYILHINQYSMLFTIIKYLANFNLLA